MDSLVQQINEHLEKWKYLDDNRREKNLQILHNRLKEINQEKTFKDQKK